MRVKVGYVILDRELVQTSRFDHFYRSDLISMMHPFFSGGWVGFFRVGHWYNYYHTIILVYLCVCAETLGYCTPTALCQMLTLDVNVNLLDWSNCILTLCICMRRIAGMKYKRNVRSVFNSYKIERLIEHAGHLN